MMGTCITPFPAKPKSGSIFEEYEDDIESLRVIPVAEAPADCNGKAINLQPEYDRHVSLELSMPQREVLRSVKVIGRIKGVDSKCTGTSDHNSIMNTMTYDVEFPDGEILKYAANVIAKNMLSQVHRSRVEIYYKICPRSSSHAITSMLCIYIGSDRKSATS